MPSFDCPALPVSQPSAWVTRFAGLVPAGGGVLDLACGDGRHTRLLASRGHPVTAVDIDIRGVADLTGEPDIEILQTDLESGSWPFAPASFAGIVITNYLHRPHFKVLPVSLQPGGLLIIDTFAAGNERLGRPRNPDFLLAPGELLSAFAQTLQVVAYEHGMERVPRPAVRQRLVAVRQAEPVELPPL
ncbi:MAG: methyltransferase domain-containing protein [Gammaproteobacteria bacterium]|nr:methyltransferase domain-containing protein [Gammaproteobacteria bacterium]